MRSSKSKTIGIDARMFGYAQTGIGGYIRHLIKQTAEKDPTNRYVIFLSPEEFDGFQLKTPNLKKVRVDAKWYGWKEQIILPWILYRHKLDLMHFTHFNSPLLYFKKSLVTIHDITPYFFPGHKMKSWFRRIAFRLVFAASVRKAAHIITVSRSTENDIVKYFKINPDKITVIYEGAEADFQVIDNRESIEKLKRKYHLHKPFLFYTGVWRNHKNLVGLIQAFALVRNQFKLDIDLVLGGKEDPYYPEVRQTWESLNLDEHIKPVGFIPQAELPLFYNAAEIFIIPSFYEGFGLIGLEAMQCGTPVISSNTTSLPEILGPAALYFNPHHPAEMAEKIALVFSDKNLYNNLRKAGFSQAQKYSWQQMGELTVKIYKNLLDGHRCFKKK